MTTVNEYEQAALAPDTTDKMVEAFRALMTEYEIKGWVKPTTWKNARVALMNYDDENKEWSQ